MAVKNSVVIYIGGINYTSKLVMPVKIAELLDERLDECTISLRNVKRSTFAPLTPVELRIENRVFYGDPSKPVARETATKQFLVGDDSADESRLHRGFYNHDISLIEVTKYADLVVVDTITFTNDIGRNYTNGANTITPIEERKSD